MKTPIYVFAKWQIKPGHLDSVITLLQKVVSASIKEEGNLFYLVEQSTNDPNLLILYEGYSDESALQQHRESAYFQNIVVGQIVPLLENREVILTTPLTLTEFLDH